MTTTERIAVPSAAMASGTMQDVNKDCGPSVKCGMTLTSYVMIVRFGSLLFVCICRFLFVCLFVC